MRVGDFDFDPGRGLITKGDVAVRLGTGLRRDLLFYFVNNKNKPVTDFDILKTVWQSRFMSDSVVRMGIHHVRRALREVGSTQCKIVNWGSHTWELIVPEESE